MIIYPYPDLKTFLDEKLRQYNAPSFITNDPISIPHGFKKKQDIEITGLFAALFAWGQRITIINKSKELIHLMDDDPYNFILGHNDGDLKPFTNFKHRTFNATDALYFIHFLRHHYWHHPSLESAFVDTVDTVDTVPPAPPTGLPVERALIRFQQYFFSLETFPSRTRKHVTSPLNKSTCKRLNMFLRWMVRKDEAGVDFGIWKGIDAKDLMCPLDLHVERVARRLGLIKRKQRDWLTVVELTAALSKMDAADPVKYDFALFNVGIEED